VCVHVCRYGFFNNKRIVLFDTLMKECSEDEVVAVLAHGEQARPGAKFGLCALLLPSATRYRQGQQERTGKSVQARAVPRTYND